MANNAFANKRPWKIVNWTLVFYCIVAICVERESRRIKIVKMLIMTTMTENVYCNLFAFFDRDCKKRRKIHKLAFSTKLLWKPFIFIFLPWKFFCCPYCKFNISNVNEMEIIWVRMKKIFERIRTWDIGSSRTFLVILFELFWTFRLFFGLFYIFKDFFELFDIFCNFSNFRVRLAWLSFSLKVTMSHYYYISE